MATETGVSAAPRRKPPTPPQPSRGGRIWLYDGDGEDAPIRLENEEVPEPGDNQMLWIDVDLESIEGLEQLWDRLGIRDSIEGIDSMQTVPQLIQHNGMIQVNVVAAGGNSSFEPMPLHCFVGRNWIATLHKGDLDLVDRFNEPFHGETDLGKLDGPSFLSMVLDWLLNGYFAAIEALQEEIDHLDEELLQRSPDEQALLSQLLQMRRRVRRLRQSLGPHREVFALLGNPESETVIGSEAAPSYQRLSERLEKALDAVENTREMIVGSFDIFMTRNAQATNEVMKRLTIVSVLLLPAAVIAGIMGMNFRVGLFDHAYLFWVTLGVMALLATTTLIIARRRKWI
ncbi:MAG: CorA family divalent cation transporter [Acidimicrobiia bacterium]